jgi:hypothetical protein
VGAGAGIGVGLGVGAATGIGMQQGSVPQETVLDVIAFLDGSPKTVPLVSHVTLPVKWLHVPPASEQASAFATLKTTSIPTKKTFKKNKIPANR